MSKTTKTKPKPWKLRRIEDVEWIDSIMSSGWNDREQYGKTMSNCRTVGFLLSESKEHIQLALSQDVECDNVNGAISIPKVAITKRRRLR